MPKLKRNAVVFTVSGAKPYEKYRLRNSHLQGFLLYVSFSFLALPNRLLWK